MKAVSTGGSTKILHRVLATEPVLEPTSGSDSSSKPDLYVDDCGLCQLIHSAAQTLGDWLGNPRRSARASNVKTSDTWMRSGLTYIDVRPDTLDKHRFDDYQEAHLKPRIMLYADPHTPAARDGKVYSGPMIHHWGSPEALELVKSWHDGCLAHHAACCKAYSGYEFDDSNGTSLPTRIIHLLGPNQLRLVESSGQKGRYAALSYCWGSPDDLPPPKTTSENLAGRLAGLRMEELPRTFRDALTLSHELGIQYLWIDSLCILQDSTTDWEKESLLMGDYYAGAQLVIGAAASENSQGGFLKPRKGSDVVDLPYFDASGRSAGIVHAKFVYATLFQLPYSTALASRGWTFQEDILARRIIFFTEHSMVWRCSVTRCDDFQDFTSRPHAWLGTLRFHSPDGSDQFWDWMAENYSDRQLRYLADKPVALRGIFDQHQKRTGAPVLYGLRSDHLLRDLAWWPSPKTSFGGGLADSPRRAELSCIPSWSWLSVDCAVMHSNAILSHHKPYEQPYQELASFRLTDDPRELVLDGPCSPVSLHRHNAENPTRFEMFSTREELMGTVFMSVYQGEASIDGASCLLTRTIGSGIIEALIIAPVDGQSKKYLRIGLALVYDPRWAAALSREQVVLI